jgi:Uncharacterized protein conserved in bacteria (DUF2059)
MNAMSRAYARQFTLQEMADAKIFFATPSGRAYMSKAGGIMSDPDISKWQTDLMQSSMAENRTEVSKMKEEVSAHLASKNKVQDKSKRK